MKARLQEGMTLKATILRKRIKPIGGSDASVDRVIFCSDPRQIKNFNKRKHKHETKSRRTKKTSLKEKMQAVRPMFEEGRERSETSSVWNKGTPSIYT